MVLSEQCNTGYMFASRAQAPALAETTKGKTISVWKKLARKKNIYLIVGFTERASNKLDNAAEHTDSNELYAAA